MARRSPCSVYTRDGFVFPACTLDVFTRFKEKRFIKSIHGKHYRITKLGDTSARAHPRQVDRFLGESVTQNKKADKRKARAQQCIRELREGMRHRRTASTLRRQNGRVAEETRMASE